MSAVPGRASTVHRPRVVLVSSLMILLAFVVQTAVLPAVGLSAAIPVVFTTVVVLAMALGRSAGAWIGFCAGLLLDLTGSGVLGLGALIGCLLGVAAAGIRVDRWRWSGLLPAIAGVAVASAGLAVLNLLALGITPSLSMSWLWLLGGSTLCCVALVPLRPWIGEVVR